MVPRRISLQDLRHLYRHTVFPRVIIPPTPDTLKPGRCLVRICKHALAFG
jgi:hypothetical protein